jgi:hypothetical protein
MIECGRLGNVDLIEQNYVIQAKSRNSYFNQRDLIFWAARTQRTSIIFWVAL